jgi:hypothetical protein
MTDLLLQPTGNPSQYEVIADEQIVGRIALYSALRGHRKPWVWSIDLAFSRLLKFGFSQLYPAFETGSVVLVECH